MYQVLIAGPQEDDLREHFHKLGLQEPKRIKLCLKRISVGPAAPPKRCSAIVECYSAHEADQALREVNNTMVASPPAPKTSSDACLIQFMSGTNEDYFRISALRYTPLQPEDIRQMEQKKRDAEASRLFVGETPG
eukprot:764888-Hanusia_phi.AAC.5